MSITELFGIDLPIIQAPMAGVQGSALAVAVSQVLGRTLIDAGVSPDRVLVIGPDVREPSFFWLAGQGGYGFQTCPAASRLAAGLWLSARPVKPSQRQTSPSCVTSRCPTARCACS